MSVQALHAHTFIRFILTLRKMNPPDDVRRALTVPGGFHKRTAAFKANLISLSPTNPTPLAAHWGSAGWPHSPPQLNYSFTFCLPFMATVSVEITGGENAWCLCEEANSPHSNDSSPTPKGGQVEDNRLSKC